MSTAQPLYDPVLRDLARLIRDNQTLAPGASRRFLDKLDYLDRRELAQRQEAQRQPFVEAAAQCYDAIVQTLSDYKLLGEPGVETTVQCVKRLAQEVLDLRQARQEDINAEEEDQPEAEAAEERPVLLNSASRGQAAKTQAPKHMRR